MKMTQEQLEQIQALMLQAYKYFRTLPTSERFVREICGLAVENTKRAQIVAVWQLFFATRTQATCTLNHPAIQRTGGRICDQADLSWLHDRSMLDSHIETGLKRILPVIVAFEKEENAELFETA